MGKTAKKHILFICLIILLTSTVVQAQGILSIENSEPSWFYYVIDPPLLTDYNYSSPNFNHYVLKYFGGAAGSSVFSPLKPGQVDTFTNLTTGSHILIGFFIPAESLVYPLKIMQLKMEQTSCERRYVISGTASQLAVTSGTGLLTDFAADAESTTAPDSDSIPAVIVEKKAFEINIDNAYQEWLRVPLAAGFSPYFTPAYYNREQQTEMAAVAIEEALYWQKGGIQLSEVKIVRNEQDLYFSIKTYTAVARGLLIYFYIYRIEDDLLSNQFTVEVNIDNPRQKNKIYLWSKANSTPLEIGNCLVSGFNMEGQVSLSLLPVEVQPDWQENYSLDLTSCYFDQESGVYEEFFYTHLDCRDIPELSEVE